MAIFQDDNVTIQQAQTVNNSQSISHTSGTSSPDLKFNQGLCDVLKYTSIVNSRSIQEQKLMHLLMEINVVM